MPRPASTPSLLPPPAPRARAGTLLAASVPVVGFNAVLMSEHFGAFFATGVIHVALLVRAIRAVLPERQLVAAVRLVLTAGAVAFGLALFVVAGYVAKSPTLGWTGGWAGGLAGGGGGWRWAGGGGALARRWEEGLSVVGRDGVAGVVGGREGVRRGAVVGKVAG